MRLKHIGTLILGLGVLSGCQTTGEPYQTGESRYQLDYYGYGEQAGDEQAQGFCRKKGFAYAHIISNTDDYAAIGPRRNVSFFCMREGDSIATPSTVVMPIPLW